MVQEKIYLDTNVIREWFVRIILGDKKDVRVIEFLRRHEEIDKFISVYGVAELIETLKKESRIQHKKLTKELIWDLIRAPQNTLTNLKIIEEYTTERGTSEYKGIVLSSKIVDFTFLCGDLKDSIHVEIAANNDLIFVTKDAKVGRVKELYPKVVGINKLIRRREK